MYRCGKCQEYKPATDFHPDKKSGLKSYCKTCGKANAYKSRRKYVLRTSYGLTVDQYRFMADQQLHCCKICGIDRMMLDRDLAVDHDHNTGAVRGLLCGPCNKALGVFSTPELLQSAIHYLEESKCPEQVEESVGA